MKLTIKEIYPSTYKVNDEDDFIINKSVSGKFKVIDINNSVVTIELDHDATNAFKKFESELEELNKRKYFSIGVR